MRASPLIITELLKKQLICFPELVDSLRAKDINFLKKFEAWLKESETILKNQNIADCSSIAALRSKLAVPLFSFEKRISVKKKQTQIASEILYDSQNILLNVLKPYELKVNSSRELIVQLLGVVKQTGAVKYNPGMGFQSFVDQLWAFVSANEQLKPGLIKVLTLVPYSDAKRLIAEVIEPGEWY